MWRATLRTTHRQGSEESLSLRNCESSRAQGPRERFDASLLSCTWLPLQKLPLGNQFLPAGRIELSRLKAACASLQSTPQPSIRVTALTQQLLELRTELEDTHAHYQKLLEEVC